MSETETSVPTSDIEPPGKTGIRADVLKWERMTVWPMFILSLVFVNLQLLLLFYSANMRPWEKRTLTTVVIVMWVIFVVDFVVRWLVQGNRKQFLKDRWLEVAGLLIPVLRPILPVYYLWRTSFFLEATPKSLRLRYQITVAAIAVFTLYLISTAVYYAERDAVGSQILTWDDSLWWGIVTITTVGYGNIVPVTVAGRILGSVLMLAGIFLVGVISASMVSYLSEQFRVSTVIHAVKDKAAYRAGVETKPARPILTDEAEWSSQASKQVEAELSGISTSKKHSPSANHRRYSE